MITEMNRFRGGRLALVILPLLFFGAPDFSFPRSGSGFSRSNPLLSITYLTCDLSEETGY
jgi:hypothetical protein